MSVVSCRRYVGKAFHTRGSAAEKLVAETVVCAWNDAYPSRRGPKLSAASVGNELKSRQLDTPVCPSAND